MARYRGVIFCQNLSWTPFGRMGLGLGRMGFDPGHRVIRGGTERIVPRWGVIQPQYRERGRFRDAMHCVFTEALIYFGNFASILCMFSKS